MNSLGWIAGIDSAACYFLLQAAQKNERPVGARFYFIGFSHF